MQEGSEELFSDITWASLDVAWERSDKADLLCEEAGLEGCEIGRSNEVTTGMLRPSEDITHKGRSMLRPYIFMGQKAYSVILAMSRNNTPLHF